MVNSQIWRVAVTSVAKILLMHHAIKIQRNVNNVLKVIQIATLLLSAQPLVESLMLNVTQAKVNAQIVTLKTTKTAPKTKWHVTKNALLCL